MHFPNSIAHYEHGDKTGKLLSHQLKQAAAYRAIPEIQVTPGCTSTHPKTINCFKNYYIDLYTSESNLDTPEIQAFLDNLNIPKISLEAQAGIEDAITSEERSQMIKSMQSGKTGGPNGFPIEFYKTFSSKLSPSLFSLYHKI